MATIKGQGKTKAKKIEMCVMKIEKKYGGRAKGYTLYY